MTDIAPSFVDWPEGRSVSMTVKELIEKLQTMPQHLPVVIDDADTQWALNIIDVIENSDCVEIGGDYSDRFGE